MKVIYGLGKKKLQPRRLIAAIGIFDGVHIGHQAIIQKTISLAKKEKGKSIVITFWPHPTKILKHKIHCLMLTSLEHRINLIGKLNPDICLVIKFSKRFSKLKPEEFIKSLRAKINITGIVVGEDFLFGKGNKGNVNLLKRLGSDLGFGVTVVPEYRIGKFSIRSNLIRSLIKNGRFAQARRCLGNYFSVYGRVGKGSLRGRLLGYPTANIKTHQEIIPPSGVYFVKIILAQKNFYGICNIGRRPTFGDVEDFVIEVHIFKFKKNIYGRKLEVIFLKRIRREKKFPDRRLLIGQIKKDELKAKALLNKSPRIYTF